MTLSLTDEKKNKIKTILNDYLCKYKISLRELARILRNLMDLCTIRKRKNNRFKIS